VLWLVIGCRWHFVLYCLVLYCLLLCLESHCFIIYMLCLKDPWRARRGSGSSSNSAPARCPALDTPSGHSAIPVNNHLNELSPNSQPTSTTSQSSDTTESVASDSAQTDFNTAQPSSDTKADQHSTGSKLNVNNLGPEFNPSEQRNFMESCVVMRLEDFAVYCVSSERTNSEIRTFIASDKKSLFLPKNLSVIHAEFTEYFLPPEEKDFQGVLYCYTF